MSNRKATAGLNSFEATFMQLAQSWLDEQIQKGALDMAEGSAMREPNADAIALAYARDVARIRAFRECAASFIDIQARLLGER